MLRTSVSGGIFLWQECVLIYQLAEINDTANNAGVPQEMDKGIDDMADQKINSEIPGGN